MGAPSPEIGWLSGLHISGYLSQTFGMWQNPPALQDFTPSRNDLAVARTLLQVDENYRLNENNTFFMREWFVYELRTRSTARTIQPMQQGASPQETQQAFLTAQIQYNFNVL